MMCYRDMTFCRAYPEKCLNPCHRAYTEKVDKGAKDWMGDNAPIALSDFSEYCSALIKPIKKDTNKE